MAHETGDPLAYVIAVNVAMRGVRLLHFAGELHEAETGADAADRRPAQKQPADERHVPQQREHDQQLKEHVDFLDLRPARRRIAGEGDRDQRSQAGTIPAAV